MTSLYSNNKQNHLKSNKNESRDKSVQDKAVQFIEKFYETLLKDIKDLSCEVSRAIIKLM